MPDPLPSFETARSEANAAIQEVVDLLPTKTPVEQLGEDSLGCGGTGVPSEGSDVTYTNHIAVVQPADFDADQFIEDLPGPLGSSFTVKDTGLDLDSPAIDLIADEHGGTLLSVSTGDNRGEKYVEIYAFSRCAQPPESGP